MKTDLSLYIHIPFCVQKCRYCDFLSFPSDEETHEKYLEILLSEIAERAWEYEGRDVISIYIGGGTPSIMPLGAIARIMDMINKAYDVSADAEITIELNPGTVCDDKLIEYKKAGINRLSIGLQSSHDSELSMLGRIHSREDFEKTFSAARAVGFDNINVDLISALPGQTVEQFRESLSYVLEHKPEHISAYSLQLEEGTYLYEHQDEFVFPSEDEDRQMYCMTNDLLAEAGYHRYEISNYSLEGYESRHNSIYWTRGNYLGLGLGAASLIDNVRYLNTDSMMVYMKGIDVCDRQVLSTKEQMEEYMFLGLRLSKGILIEEFEQEFGKKFDSIFGETVEKLLREKLIINIDGRIMLTPRGTDVSNYVFGHFLLS